MQRFCHARRQKFRLSFESLEARCVLSAISLFPVADTYTRKDSNVGGSEVLDGVTISEWNNPGRSNFDLDPGTSRSQIFAPGAASNNGSKRTPALSADIFGDWREEVIWRRSDNTALDARSPPGSSIDPSTGLFTWTPDQQYGNQSIDVTVLVTDTGTPAKTDSATIHIDVVDPFPWHHSDAPFDVNHDGKISALDALVIVNALQRSPSSPRLPRFRDAGSPYLDVNRDGYGTALDALEVINQMGRQRQVASPLRSAEQPLQYGWIDEDDDSDPIDVLMGQGHDWIGTKFTRFIHH
ncbi:dockerin type I domain-containing protein [Novipirellula sp.]|uniref:rhamnogalacturonan lyase family protein n=1 Tax=Novipirellula sp. TaxID=2795430 RepID=UPI003563C2E6